MFGLSLWQALADLLGVAVLLGAATRRWQTAIVASALLSDWALCSLMAHDANGAPLWNWPAWAVIDLASGAFVAAASSSRIGQIIALTYAFELACHATYGLSGETTEALGYYWESTHYVAWTQAFLLAVWIGRDSADALVGYVNSTNNRSRSFRRRRPTYNLRWAALVSASAKARAKRLAPTAVELFIISLYVLRNVVA